MVNMFKINVNIFLEIFQFFDLTRTSLNAQKEPWLNAKEVRRDHVPQNRSNRSFGFQIGRNRSLIETHPLMESPWNGEAAVYLTSNPIKSFDLSCCSAQASTAQDMNQIHYIHRFWKQHPVFLQEMSGCVCQKLKHLQLIHTMKSLRVRRRLTLLIFGKVWDSELRYRRSLKASSS